MAIEQQAGAPAWRLTSDDEAQPSALIGEQLRARTAWLQEITSQIAHVNRIDAEKAGEHPAYRALLRQIDASVDVGVQRGYITPEEAHRL